MFCASKTYLHIRLWTVQFCCPRSRLSSAQRIMKIQLKNPFSLRISPLNDEEVKKKQDLRERVKPRSMRNFSAPVGATMISSTFFVCRLMLLNFCSLGFFKIFVKIFDISVNESLAVFKFPRLSTLFKACTGVFKSFSFLSKACKTSTFKPLYANKSNQPPEMMNSKKDFFFLLLRWKVT